jgi:cyclophilin family peptidyl-prolyl cis-trans isomerase
MRTSVAVLGLVMGVVVCAPRVAAARKKPSASRQPRTAAPPPWRAPSAPLQARGARPIVELVTNLGSIRLELYPGRAPETVENFLGYVRAGHYDGTIFHRVIDNFMIQGGGYTANHKKKPTHPPIKNEADNQLKNTRGTIAMARPAAPHSATAQFFINVKDNAFLDHRNRTPRGWGYCVFGRVIRGMDVVDRIKKLRTGPGGTFPRDVPLQAVVIKRARLR